MSVVYIGVGSNLGNRRENIEKAFLLIEERGIKILKRSSSIETDPVGGIDVRGTEDVLKIKGRICHSRTLLSGIQRKPLDPRLRHSGVTCQTPSLASPPSFLAKIMRYFG